MALATTTDRAARLSDCSIIDLSVIPDRRGNLSVIESLQDIPFAIRRAYWIYDVPGGESRTGHAFKETSELLVALSGSFDVVLSDGQRNRTVSLNRSFFGLYVPCMIWRELVNFSTNAVCLVLASTTYSESDYLRDYHLFVKAREARGRNDHGR